MSNTKFSLLRASGWGRFGLAAAVAVLFMTPMLWALGAFGAGDEGLHRATIFGFSGLWLFMVAGYVVGWALKGFMYRIKDSDDESGGEETAHRPPSPPPGAHRPPPR